MITFLSLGQKSILPIKSILAYFFKLAQNITNDHQKNESERSATEKIISECNRSDKEFVCYIHPYGMPPCVLYNGRTRFGTLYKQQFQGLTWHFHLFQQHPLQHSI